MEEAIASGVASRYLHNALKFWQIFCQFLLRGAAFLILPLFFRVEIAGRNRLRNLKPPVILVANHKSYLDATLIGLALPAFSKLYPLRFIAKEEFFRHGWQRSLFKSLAAVRTFIGQGLERSLAEPKTILGSGGCVAVFPEGMRIPGETLGAPKLGIGALARECPQVPIIPIGIWGTHHARWTRFLLGRKRFSVSVGKPFTIPSHIVDIAEASDFAMKKIEEEYLTAIEADVLDYRESLWAKIFHHLLRKTLGPIIRFFWVDAVEGLHHLPPEGAIIIASNHHSYFDFLCFSSISKRKVHYLAAEKFFESALWRPLMKATGQIRVDRKHPDKKKMWAQVVSALEQGRAIGIFPEGTRSSDGCLGPAFNGVGRLALKSRAPVVPVGMIGTFEIMSRHDKRPRLKKAKIKIGAPLHFPELHDLEHTEEHFKLVTDKVMARIAELLEEDRASA